VGGTVQIQTHDVTKISTSTRRPGKELKLAEALAERTLGWFTAPWKPRDYLKAVVGRPRGTNLRKRT